MQPGHEQMMHQHTGWHCCLIWARDVHLLQAPRVHKHMQPGLIECKVKGRMLEAAKLQAHRVCVQSLDR